MRRRAARAVHDTFRSLRVRNFRLFFVGQLVSQIGSWLTMVALVLLILHRTGSGIAVGLLAAAQFGPVLVLGAWAGLIADRSDKRRLLLSTQALQMLQSFGLAVLAFLPSAPTWAFYAAALAGGVVLAFDNPARRSFVSEMVPPAQIQNAVSLNSALMTSSRIVGPALAGLLVVTVGFGWCFAIDAVSYVAVLAGLWMMRTEELVQPPATERGKGQVRDGLRYVRRTHELWVPLVMMAVVGTLTFNFNVVLPLFVERTLGGTDATYTLLYSVLSIGSLLGALIAARRKEVSVTTIAVTSFVFGVSMLVLSVMPSLRAAFPAALIVGLASVGFMTTGTAMMQLRAAPQMRGRVLALQAIVFLGSTPVGGPLLGWVCDTFGSRAGLALGGVAAVLAAGWGLLATRRVREAEPGRVGRRPLVVEPDTSAA
jgi:MFS family permease